MGLPAFLTTSAYKLVTRPVLRLGGALLLGGALAASVAPSPSPVRAVAGAGSYRLVLETESNPACYYGSAWNDGDVILSHDASDGRKVTLTNRYVFPDDGCTWEATEVLTPSGDGYSYSYTERPVACPDDAAASIACPRQGVVAVVPVE
jgi:hypothetical protein